MSQHNQALYRNGARTRVTFGGKHGDALAYYKKLLEFIIQIVPPTESHVTLLDVGCGSAWSSYCFAEAGYETTGVDLNFSAFEPPATARLRLVEASAMDLPFPHDFFDVVLCYQCLEHIPDPGAALREMARVVKPNGVIAIVGPNLVSPFAAICIFLKEMIGGKLIFRRHEGTQHHPYGNTAAERVIKVFAVAALLLNKLLDSELGYNMRIPDSTPPFHGDNDACYLCNPIDIIKSFQRNGFKLLCKGRPGRAPFSYLLAGGTWVAARKPVFAQVPAQSAQSLLPQ
jgi:SAM-dependent methyltransferase